jgi:hypothetical protein
VIIISNIKGIRRTPVPLADANKLQDGIMPKATRANSNLEIVLVHLICTEKDPASSLPNLQAVAPPEEEERGAGGRRSIIKEDAEREGVMHFAFLPKNKGGGMRSQGGKECSCYVAHLATTTYERTKAHTS